MLSCICNKVRLVSVYSFVCFIILTGCRYAVLDAEQNLADTSTRITIHEPQDNKVYKNGEILPIKITFERKDKIKYVEVKLVNINTGDTLYYFNNKVKADYYYFITEEIQLNLLQKAELELTATTWQDSTYQAIAFDVLDINVDAQ